MLCHDQSPEVVKDQSLDIRLNPRFAQTLTQKRVARRRIALRLCEAGCGHILTYDGEFFHLAAT
jgi:hypothetical protein